MSALADSLFLVMDTETTGIDPATCKVVEFAWVLTDLTGPRAAGTTLVDPGVPIPAEASAVHHLVDTDVAGQPNLDQVLAYLPQHLRGFNPRAFVAHNAAFDSAFLPSLRQRPWLCTYRLARRLMPDLPAFGNQYLRYQLNLDVPEAQGLAAHRALADAYVTAALLRHLLTGVIGNPAWPQDIPALAAHLEEPMILKTCGFGKHKGTPWADVPQSYLTWMLGAGGMADLDIDTKATAQFYLKEGRP
jgi:exodeoxyribonuclease X